MNRTIAEAAAALSAGGLVLTGLVTPAASHAAPRPVSIGVVSTTPYSPVTTPTRGPTIEVTIQFETDDDQSASQVEWVALRPHGSTESWGSARYFPIRVDYPGEWRAATIKLSRGAPLGLYDIGVTYRWSSKENCHVDASTGIEDCTTWSQTVENRQAGQVFVRAATTLSANASPEPVRKGGKLTVSGTLKHFKAGHKKYIGYGSRSVGIYFDPKGTTGETFMGRVTTKSNGTYSKKFTAKKDGRWYAHVTGTATNAPATSKLDYVNVT